MAQFDKWDGPPGILGVPLIEILLYTKCCMGVGKRIIEFFFDVQKRIHAQMLSEDLEYRL